MQMYETINPSHWEFWVPLYFFALSISAGSVLIIALSDLFKLNISPSFRRIGHLVGLVTIALAPIFIILDLGQPLRFVNMLNPANFRVTSPMSWGGILLILYGVALLISSKNHLLEILLPSHKMVATATENPGGFGKVIFALAFLVAIYPGVELGVVKGKTLWNSELLPIYFISTTILAGLAVYGLLLPKNNGKDTKLTDYLRKGMIIFILLSLLWISLRSLILLGAGGTGSEVLKILWTNKVFVGGELLTGLVIPLAILIFGKVKSNPNLLVIVSVFVLIGVFCMRYALVFAGLAA